MTQLYTNLTKHLGKKQTLAVGLIIGLTFILALWLMRPARPGVATNEQVNAGNKITDSGQLKAKLGTNEVELTSAQAQAIGLQTASVGPATMTTTKTLPGELKLNTDQEAHISSPLAGQVEHVYVSTGQTIKKGQPLATLLVPQLVEMQRSLQMASSRQVLAQSTYTRERTLWQQGISAKQDYLQAESVWQQAKIEAAAARQSLKAYGAEMGGQTGRLTIYAPVSGTISTKDISIGESVQPASQLFSIARLDALWVEFAVPPAMAGLLYAQMPLLIKTTSDAPPLSARLLTYTPSADIKTRSLIARAQLEGLGAHLRPGMLVSVGLSGEPRSAAISVQNTALQTLHDQTVVFTLQTRQGKTIYHSQPVSVGTQDEQRSEIKRGLSAGTRYVTSGSFALKSELEKSEAEND